MKTIEQVKEYVINQRQYHIEINLANRNHDDEAHDTSQLLINTFQHLLDFIDAEEPPEIVIGLSLNCVECDIGLVIVKDNPVRCINNQFYCEDCYWEERVLLSEPDEETP